MADGIAARKQRQTSLAKSGKYSYGKVGKVGKVALWSNSARKVSLILSQARCPKRKVPMSPGGKCHHPSSCSFANPNPFQPLYLQPTPTLLVSGITTLRGGTLCGHLCRQCSPLVLIGPPLIQARCHVTCRVSHRLLWRAGIRRRSR